MPATADRQRRQTSTNQPREVLAAQQLLPALGNQDLLGFTQPIAEPAALDPGPWLADAEFGAAEFLVGLRDASGPGLGSAGMLAQSLASPC